MPRISMAASFRAACVSAHSGACGDGAWGAATRQPMTGIATRPPCAVGSAAAAAVGAAAAAVAVGAALGATQEGKQNSPARCDVRPRVSKGSFNTDTFQEYPVVRRVAGLWALGRGRRAGWAGLSGGKWPSSCMTTWRPKTLTHLLLPPCSQDDDHSLEQQRAALSDEAAVAERCHGPLRGLLHPRPGREGQRKDHPTVSPRCRPSQGQVRVLGR